MQVQCVSLKSHFRNSVCWCIISNLKRCFVRALAVPVPYFRSVFIINVRSFWGKYLNSYQCWILPWKYIFVCVNGFCIWNSIVTTLYFLSYSYQDMSSGYSSIYTNNLFVFAMYWWFCDFFSHPLTPSPDEILNLCWFSNWSSILLLLCRNF